MLLREFGDALATSFYNIWAGVFEFLPRFILALIIFIAGWVVGAVLGRVVAQIIDAIKVDSVLRGVGAEDLMARAGIRLHSGGFIGALVKWFIIVVFLVASLNILGLEKVNDFLSSVVLGYLPQVIAAAIILVLAALLAETLQRIVTSSAKAASMPAAGFLGGVTRWAVWIFAILAALAQLGIAAVFSQTLFTAVLAFLVLAGGLAFGLGGRDAAAKYLERLRRDISE